MDDWIRYLIIGGAFVLLGAWFYKMVPYAHGLRMIEEEAPAFCEEVCSSYNRTVGGWEFVHHGGLNITTLCICRGERIG